MCFHQEVALGQHCHTVTQEVKLPGHCLPITWTMRNLEVSRQRGRDLSPQKALQRQWPPRPVEDGKGLSAQA